MADIFGVVVCESCAVSVEVRSAENRCWETVGDSCREREGRLEVEVVG